MAEIEPNPFLRAPPDFQSRDAAHRYLVELARQNGVANFTYLGVDIPGLKARRDYVISTYSEAWKERYFDQGYQHVDPVIALSLRGVLPYDWRMRDERDARIRDFFGEAAEFGVKRQGISIPIRGARGERCVFSVNVDLPDGDWSDFKRRQSGNLTMLAYHLHLAVMNLELPPEADDPRLSRREIQVLKWASRGKSAFETAAILDISPRTVECYIQAAEVKLRATNKTQAVATAIQRDLLV